MCIIRKWQSCNTDSALADFKALDVSAPFCDVCFSFYFIWNDFDLSSLCWMFVSWHPDHSTYRFLSSPSLLVPKLINFLTCVPNPPTSRGQPDSLNTGKCSVSLSIAETLIKVLSNWSRKMKLKIWLKVACRQYITKMMPLRQDWVESNIGEGECP